MWRQQWEPTLAASDCPGDVHGKGLEKVGADGPGTQLFHPGTQHNNQPM